MVERFWQSNSNFRSEAEIEILTVTAVSFAVPNWVSKWLLPPYRVQKIVFYLLSVFVANEWQKGIADTGSCRNLQGRIESVITPNNR